MPSFKDFVLNADPNKKPYRSQSLWIKHNDKIEVDFIGRFENYQEDWKKITKLLGVQKELVKLNSSSHLPYQEYYNDTLKDFVAKTYQEDIKRFDYEF